MGWTRWTGRTGENVSLASERAEDGFALTGSGRAENGFALMGSERAENGFALTGSGRAEDGFALTGNRDCIQKGESRGARLFIWDCGLFYLIITL